MKSPFNKNDILELKITSNGIDGEGIAHVDGYTVFVRGAIAGEIVRAKVILVKPTFCVAIIEKILANSPARVKPVCEYASKCGGCSMQHISYDKQVEIKCEQIKNTFRKNAKLDVTIDNVVGSEKQYNYRNKLAMPIRAVSTTQPYTAVVGFFRKGTHDVVDIKECHLQTGSISALVSSLKEFMLKQRITAYCESSNTGLLRHITMRVLGNHYTICLVGNGAEPNRVAGFNEYLKNLYGDNYSLFYNQNDKKTNAIYGTKFKFIGGKEKPVNIDGLDLTVHPASFFQVNDNVRQSLFDAVKEAVEGLKVDTGIEAYAGAGLLACKLSSNLSKVYGIEISKESLISHEEIKKLNGINNVTMITGDCETELPKLLKQSSIDKSKTALILDPPRSGISSAECVAIDSSQIKTVIYISCNYSTLARDIANMKNYKLQKLQAFDMFPQTGNVEVMAILQSI